MINIILNTSQPDMHILQIHTHGNIYDIKYTRPRDSVFYMS